MAKLYLISQKDNNDYDTYSDAVVCANSADEARYIHPSSYYKFRDGKLWFQYADGSEREEQSGLDGWAHPGKVAARYIGEAANGIGEGKVICASFHAG